MARPNLLPLLFLSVLAGLVLDLVAASPYHGPPSHPATPGASAHLHNGKVEKEPKFSKESKKAVLAVRLTMQDSYTQGCPTNPHDMDKLRTFVAATFSQILDKAGMKAKIKTGIVDCTATTDETGCSKTHVDFVVQLSTKKDKDLMHCLTDTLSEEKGDDTKNVCDISGITCSTVAVSTFEVRKMAKKPSGTKLHTYKPSKHMATKAPGAQGAPGAGAGSSSSTGGDNDSSSSSSTSTSGDDYSAGKAPSAYDPYPSDEDSEDSDGEEEEEGEKVYTGYPVWSRKYLRQPETKAAKGTAAEDAEGGSPDKTPAEAIKGHKEHKQHGHKDHEKHDKKHQKSASKHAKHTSSSSSSSSSSSKNDGAYAGSLQTAAAESKTVLDVPDPRLWDFSYPPLNKLQ